MIRSLLLPEYENNLPVSHKDLGGNVCFRGLPGTGKTKGMVAYCFRLVEKYGYKWSNVVANFHVFLDRNGATDKNGWAGGIEPPGFRHMDNDHIRKWVRKVYRKSKGTITDQIIMIDEIDQVYSHKMSGNDEHIEDLLTLWQDQKLANYLLYTKHIGRGCNILIRQASEVSIKPIIRGDTLYLPILDGNVMQKKFLTFGNQSRFHNHYWRWEPVF